MVTIYSLPSFMRPSEGNRGLTLLELLVVLLIVLVLAGLMIPQISLPQSLDGTARQISGLVQALHDKARATKLMYRLHFNVSTDQYWITSVKGGVDGPITDTLFQVPRSLPRDIQFQGIWGSHRGHVKEGETFMQFFPVGRVEPTVIYLTNHREVMSLLVHPVTGSVEIIQGHYIPRGWKDVWM